MAYTELNMEERVTVQIEKHRGLSPAGLLVCWGVALLVMCVQHGQSTRRPHSGGIKRRGQISDIVSIHLRPPETKDRQMSAHF